METKICKVCGRELPWTDFRLTKGDVRAATCIACIAEKRAQTRCERAQVGGGKTAPFSDQDFANMSIGEVVRLMGRAKKWLESRGFEIAMTCVYKEAKIRKIKLE